MGQFCHQRNKIQTKQNHNSHYITQSTLKVHGAIPRYCAWAIRVSL